MSIKLFAGVISKALLLDLDNNFREIPGTTNVKHPDYGAVGDGVTDDTAAIQAAITAGATGKTFIIFPRGVYVISSTLTGLENVNLIGGEEGRQSQPAIAPVVEILWAGGAAAMLQYGYGGAVVTGGSMDGIRLNGASIATHAIAIKDHQHGAFEQLQLSNVTVAGIYMTNTNTFDDPTGFSRFEDIQIMLRGGGTQTANGIHFDGFLGAGVQGTTLNTFKKIRIEHANGTGILFGEAADGNTFANVLTFRADVETGFGIRTTAVIPAGILNNVFTNLLCSGGIRIESENTAYWTIVGLNDVDVNTSIDPVVSGPGAGEVTVVSSISGKLSGLNRLDNNRSTKHSDNMLFQLYDTANSLLLTSQATYLVGGDVTGVAIADGGVAGGCVSLITHTDINDILFITTGNGSFFDYNKTLFPEMCISFVPVVLANCQYQIGFMDEVDGSPANGIYLEAKNTSETNWTLNTVSSGVPTTVISTVDIAVAANNAQFRIIVGTDAVTFLWRAGGEKNWETMGKITTNIPTAGMSALVLLKTLSGGVNASALVYDLKLGADLEY